jgi:hypothetical protein
VEGRAQRSARHTLLAASDRGIAAGLPGHRLRHLVPSLKAVAELLGPARKALGKAGVNVQLTGTVRTLEGASAFSLLVEHRQVDLDVLPVGEFAAKDRIAALAASSPTPAD